MVSMFHTNNMASNQADYLPMNFPQHIVLCRRGGEAGEGRGGGRARVGRRREGRGVGGITYAGKGGNRCGGVGRAGERNIGSCICLTGDKSRQGPLHVAITSVCDET